MKTNKEIKRNEKMAARAKFEAFRHHVNYVAGKKGIAISTECQALAAELKLIQAAGLMEGFQKLESLMRTMEEEIGIKPAEDCPQLNGATVPYILGITTAIPTHESPLAAMNPEKLPMQITLRLTTDDRLTLTAWLKDHEDDYTLSTRLGQPIIKLSGIIVELQRIVPSL